jgi:hypothetical protein
MSAAVAFRFLCRSLALVVVATATGVVHAQANTPYGEISVGQSHFGLSCGTVAGMTCKNSGTAVSLTAGDMFSPNWGAELSYLNFGHVDHGYGTIDAQALDLALVARLPVSEHWEFSGKVGATYGITHIPTVTEAGLVSGRGSGWGVGYGVGVDYNFTRNFSASVEWQRHDLHFAGQGTSPVSIVSLGVGFRF